MLTTLSFVKKQLGIAADDTTNDDLLGMYVGSASTYIRNYCKRWLGAIVDEITATNPPVLTCRDHGLFTGDTVVISRSNSTPNINGTHVVTVIDDNTFSVPGNVSVVGTLAYIQKQYTEFYDGNNSQLLILRNRPVYGISDLRLDYRGYYGVVSDDNPTPFDDDTVLVEGVDWTLKRLNDNPNAYSKSGLVCRINAIWPPMRTRIQGFLTEGMSNAMGNIRATYVAGYMPVPTDLQLMANMTVVQIIRMAALGQPVDSQSLDYYSYTVAKRTDSKGANPFMDVNRGLARYREAVA